MKKYLVLIFIVFSATCSATTVDELFLLEAIKVGKKTQELLKGKSIVEQLPLLEAFSEKNIANPVAFDILMQELSTKYSFAGQHKKVLMSNDRASDEDYSTLEDLTKFAAKDAVHQILNSAKTHQIVMINEAHDRSQHRVLTYRLLEGLWKQGFRYFAAETLAENSRQKINQGYISNTTGYYTREAIFANLILRAKEIGFEIVSYDLQKPRKLKTTEERETNSAQTIKEKVFDKDPSAKIIIHVGYSHISEDKWLASKLKAITKLETLTIDQTKRMEKSAIKYEHPTYAMAVKNNDLKKPFVFVKQKGEIWSSASNKWDISVFWPRTIYKQGRPDWADLGRSEHNIVPDWCKKKYPCMVEVFKFGNDDEIAMDRVIISSLEENKVIFLLKGKNTIVVTGDDGMQIHKTTMAG